MTPGSAKLLEMPRRQVFSGDMKVFISWSGQKSKDVAELLNEWIPNVVQGAEPWFSPDDIGKGEIWFNSIADALADTSFGIVCLTKENFKAPWILFEAGALCKGLLKNRVCPLLVDLEPKHLSAPLSNFNCATTCQEDISKLFRLINSTATGKPLPDERFKKAFEKWWPEYNQKLGNILITEPLDKISVERTPGEMIGEILETVRSINSTVQQGGTAGLPHDRRWPPGFLPGSSSWNTLGAISPATPQAAQMMLGDLRWAPMLMDENIRVFGHQGMGEKLILAVSKKPSDTLARNLQALADVYGRKLVFSVMEALPSES
jgi:hypothetical protein